MAKPIRRNIAHLTDAERTSYINAVVQADSRFWSGGPVSYWDFQDLAHQTTHVHGGPKFLLWHRELCRRYEALLQEIDPSVALHYWDWTTDPRSSPNGNGGFTNLSDDTFMGTMSGDVEGALASLHNGGELEGSRDATGLPQDPPQTISRSMEPGAGTDVTDAAILSASEGFAQPQQFQAFRQKLEDVHGDVHVNFGPGNIGDPSGHKAFQDPMVFLLHSNVDRLYAMWQAQAGEDWRLDVNQVYGVDAGSTGDDGLSGNTLAPWDGSSGAYPFTPAGGLVEVKPYLAPDLVEPPCYDTMPVNITKVAPADGEPMRFIDVPTGKTTARALRLDVRSCTPVVAHATLTGDAAFSLLSDTVPAPMADGYTVTTLLVWVRYHAGAPLSSANGHLSVTLDGSPETYEIDIVANAITKPVVAVSMVLDSSGSMASPSGVEGTDRMGVLHQAAPTFVALLEDTDGVGVIRFDTDAVQVAPVKVADSLGSGGGRDLAMAAINAQATNPLGMTAIGDGIESAHNQLLDAPPQFAANRAILVFTDGDETESKYISEVSGLIDEHVYAVGLGTAEQVKPEGLNNITNGTGGYTMLTGPLGTDGVMRLAKYFTQVLAGVTNTEIVTDPPGFVEPGKTVKIPFPLTEADQRCDAIVLCEAPGAIRLTLTAPDGTTVMSGSDARSLMAPAMNCLRVELPLACDPTVLAGSWTANISLDEAGFKKYLTLLERRKARAAIQRLQTHGMPFTLTVHADSSLEMKVKAVQLDHAPGSQVEVVAELLDSGIPLEGRGVVQVLVTAPDGASHTVTLHETAPGIHRTMVPLPQPGHYALLVKGAGKTFSGKPFKREQLRSAAVWVDRKVPPQPCCKG
jgi:hypothetical protein